MPFEFELPEAFNAADYFVDRNVREGRGEKTAIRCGSNQFTYRDVQAGVNRFGNTLLSLGVRMEERIALLMLDTEVFPQAFFGSIKMGAIPICLNTLMRPKDYEYFLNDSRARVLVIDAHLLPSIEPIRGNLPFLKQVIVVNGEAPAGDLQLKTLWAGQSEVLDPAPTKPDDACFWLYSSG
ncbi:MAG: AMP-binding protein, partial [Sedimenticola sp.]|nr:AMP-binding protein [Sedimenticola sp.]